MKRKPDNSDPFSDRIREILVGSSLERKKGNFRELLVAEVRSYSREVQDAEALPQLFTRLCDLIVDCQSVGIPDESLRLLVAQLFLETSASAAPIDRELKALTGMDISGIRAAREHLKDECVESILLQRAARGRKKMNTAGPESAVHDHI